MKAKLAQEFDDDVPFPWITDEAEREAMQSAVEEREFIGRVLERLDLITSIDAPTLDLIEERGARGTFTMDDFDTLRIISNKAYDALNTLYLSLSPKLRTRLAQRLLSDEGFMWAVQRRHKREVEHDWDHWGEKKRAKARARARARANGKAD